ncbi:hypothetical protein B0H66DRAFT_146950 [Apodospora peruviana]|uniref:UBC core domain-containing protein n=1 Tax=Apodospora peruviana TaxID=516989 RepID=A0AAE0MB86_9PEZI|nr:hypothetical protein B0H66DRAFT_146950 [Apodospora peruviana]
MDVLGSRFPHQDQDLQILEDEQLARTMQQGFDRGSLGLGSQFDSSDLEMAVNSPSFGSLEHLRAYGRDLLNTKCCKCKTSLVGCAESIVSRTREQLKQGCLHPLLRCPNSGCRARTCVGCGDYSYCTTAFDSIKSKAKESLVWWWCDKARIFLAFSLLCGPEFKQLDILNNQTAPQPITERLRTRFKHSKSDAGPSVSEKVQAFEKGAKPAKLSHKSARRADSQLSKGTGYGGSESSSSSLHKIIHRAKTGSTPEEQTWESYFRALAIVLPDSGRIREQDGTTFDAIPQPLLFAMISRSPLLRKASELLRNDSIEEIATQVQLYAALFDFLESVRSHRDTVCTLYYHQCLYSLPEQLLHACLSPTVPVDSKLEITEPLHEIVKKFAVPCAYFLQMVSSHSQSFQLEEEQALIALTKRFCGVAKAQEEGYQRLFGKKEARRSQEIGAEMLPMSSVTTRARGLREAEKRQDKIKEQAEAWHREHRVKELCDDKILSSFYFATKAESLGLARPAPGRMKKLITQLASLRTDLPEGIYIRHASSRVDVMKVLIIGPADTPYENGLFEFDLFCGEKWPVAPPEMQFRTTGGGAVTFNPNLYNNGKVCLSLLGTWQGPSWEPNMSTILQVLISIQGMSLAQGPAKFLSLLPALNFIGFGSYHDLCHKHHYY